MKKQLAILINEPTRRYLQVPKGIVVTEIPESVPVYKFYRYASHEFLNKSEPLNLIENQQTHGITSGTNPMQTIDDINKRPSAAILIADAFNNFDAEDRDGLVMDGENFELTFVLVDRDETKVLARRQDVFDVAVYALRERALADKTLDFATEFKALVAQFKQQ
jgi:hypothetical protein